MKFHARAGKLFVQETENSNGEVLIHRKFQRSENRELATEFLRKVAAQLNEMEPMSDEMAELLQSAETEINNARTAENFLETPKFSL